MQMLFESRKCNHVQHTYTHTHTGWKISAIFKVENREKQKKKTKKKVASCENLKLHNEIDARNVQRPSRGSSSPKTTQDFPLPHSRPPGSPHWQMPQKKQSLSDSFCPTSLQLQVASCATDAIELVGAVSRTVRYVTDRP